MSQVQINKRAPDPKKPHKTHKDSDKVVMAKMPKKSEIQPTSKPVIKSTNKKITDIIDPTYSNTEIAPNNVNIIDPSKANKKNSIHQEYMGDYQNIKSQYGPVGDQDFFGYGNFRNQMPPQGPYPQRYPNQNYEVSNGYPVQMTGSLKNHGQAISLVNYHIIGSHGWQRINGYRKGMNYQPLLIMRRCRLYGLVFSYAGVDHIQPITLYILKNFTNDIPTPESNSVVGILTISEPINSPLMFTIGIAESIEVDNHTIAWKNISDTYERNDKLSLYCDNLDGVNLEIYFEF